MLSLVLEQENFSNNKSPLVLITKSEKESLTFERFLKSTCDEEIQVARLPFISHWGVSRYENLRVKKLEFLNGLNLLASKKRTVFIVSIISVLEKNMSVQSYLNHSWTVKVGDEVYFDEIEERMTALSYLRSDYVSLEGEYSLRSNIFDVYSNTHSQVVRIEFLGDKISEIHSINSKVNLSELTLGPSSDFIINSEKKDDYLQKIHDSLLALNVMEGKRKFLMESFYKTSNFPGIERFFKELDAGWEFTYLGFQKNTLFVFTRSFEEFGAYFVEKIGELSDGESAKFADEITVPIKDMFENPLKFQDYLKDKKTVFLSSLDISSTVLNFSEDWEEKTKFKTLSHLTFKKKIQQYSSLDNFFLKALAISSKQEEEIARQIFEKNFNLLSVKEFISALLSEGRNESGSKQDLFFVKMSLEEPLFLKDQFAIVPLKDFLTKKHLALTSASEESDKLKHILDIQKDDYVIHVDYGIGRFQGIVTLAVGGALKDLIKIEYFDKDIIYLPVENIFLLYKYRDLGDPNSSLDRLGNKKWIEKKAKIQKSLEEFSKKILENEALRKQKKGFEIHAFSPDYKKLVEDFEYEETPDQTRIIHQIEEELLSGHLMDRLIVGDVGFGKTEIAIRNVFLLVSEGYQAMIMAPTTMLSSQHFLVFKRRLEKFAITVRLLNRSVSKTDQKQITEDFKNHRIDVLIGTHRLLSKDVEAKKLGLIVIDEEHKFGVGHKETLRTLGLTAHSLSLSATPIPRSLHMALVGLKDVSILKTPPPSRKPVKTMVAPYTDALVIAAIEMELKRQGQVFYLSNRIESHGEVSAHLRKLIPHATVVSLSGRTPPRESEQIILDFLEKKFSILVCSTIIESGVDMPSVNTLIVEESENFGLSQLHQIRGRIGRGALQGYCYFLTQKDVLLPEESKRRLEVLMTHQELGAGFLVANYDLDLRGSGNLIGKEQSGHMDHIGLELYLHMLEEVMEQVRATGLRKMNDLDLKLELSLSMSKTYIENESARLGLYRKVFGAKEKEQVEFLKEQTVKRYGALPEDVEQVFLVGFIKVSLTKMLCYRLKKISGKLFEIYVESSEMVTALMPVSKTKDYELHRVPFGFELRFKHEAVSQKNMLEILEKTFQEIELKVFYQ